MSKIIAANTSLNASAGFFENGKPIFCIQEERLRKIKNFGGIPSESLDYIFKNFVNPNDIDAFVLTNEKPFIIEKESYYRYYNNVFEDGIKRSRESKPVRNLKEKVKKNSLYQLINSTSANSENVDNSWIVERGIDESKIVYQNHHLCHAAAVYYGMATDLNKEYLVFTLDGGGDNLTSTVYIGKEGRLRKISDSHCYSIGNMYSAITYFLGFNPHEHEYKLMGLAPYVNPDYAKKYKDYFSQFLAVDANGAFHNPTSLSHSIFFSRLLTELRKDRFDNIAAGLQCFCEEIISEWVLKNIELNGIADILLSGGVFMNVKTNQVLSENDQINSIDVFPSCGDETNIFGAAFDHHNKINDTKSLGLLNKFTLGPKPVEDLETILSDHKECINFEFVEDPEAFIADKLASNKIVARCSGEMEFGARSLGNRSILANPNSLSNVNKINRAVKKRDFWMPFAPAILQERAEELIKIPATLKSSGSPYMMFAFDTVAERREDFVCGIHQADFTARAEIVDKERYPSLHKIISLFDDKTGIPSVLNTSFNLHGYPIVNNAEEAIHVLINSEIDYLVIETYVVTRRNQSN